MQRGAATNSVLTRTSRGGQQKGTGLQILESDLSSSAGSQSQHVPMSCCRDPEDEWDHQAAGPWSQHAVKTSPGPHAAYI